LQGTILVFTETLKSGQSCAPYIQVKHVITTPTCNQMIMVYPILRSVVGPGGPTPFHTEESKSVQEVTAHQLSISQERKHYSFILYVIS